MWCLLLLLAMFIASCRKTVPADFIFIKIGYPETKDSYGFGARYFVQSDFKKDSATVKVTSTEWEDTLQRSQVYRVALPDSLKQAFFRFYDYLFPFENGTLPWSKYNEPMIYCGGDYLLAFKDPQGKDRYYHYILNDMPREAAQFYGWMFHFLEHLPEQGHAGQQWYINADSVATAFCTRKGMEEVMPMPPVKKIIRYAIEEK